MNLDRLKELEAENAALKDQLETVGIRATDTQLALSEQIGWLKDENALLVMQVRAWQQEWMRTMLQNSRLEAVAEAAENVHLLVMPVDEAASDKLSALQLALAALDAASKEDAE